MRILIFAAVAAVSLSGQVIRTNPGFYKDTVARNDDGSSDFKPLGFTINFFGKIRDSVYVNNNGNLTFDDALATYTPFGLQKTSREIIAPYFADVDTRAPQSALVSFGQDTVNGHKAFAANYVNVGYFKQHADKLNSFQVVVIDRSDTGAGNFTIEFNYERVTWETGDASGGVGGYGGVPATVGWSNGTTDPGTSFELPGSMVSGAFLDSGPMALVRAHLNTSQIGRLVFQARDGVISPGLTVQGGPVLPDGTVGQPYSFTFSAVGVDGTISWDAVADLAMPAGLKFSNGKLSGTPTTTGTYSFTVSAAANVEGEAVTVYQRGTVTIGIPTLAIRTSCPVPPATVGQLYSTTFTASGLANPLWSVADLNTLPPGMTLSSTGKLSGAPSLPGIYNFLVHAGPGAGASASTAEKICGITVNPAAVQLTNGCAMPSGTVGVPYSQILVPDGGSAPYHFSLIGQLPRGLSLSTDGRISGLPQFADSDAFDIQISDSRSHVIRQSCTIGVSEASVQIASACPLPRATTGAPYSAALTATGGAGPYTWSVAGTLPPGLTLGSGQAITGTPMAAGAYQFRLVATDAAGNQSGSACSLPVLYGPLGIGGCPLPEATIGDTYQAALRPTGGSQPFYWSTSGSLPPGLQLMPDGTIQGKVTTVGEYQFGVSLRDTSTLATVQTCSMKVKPLALRLSSLGPGAPGKLAQPYSMRFAAAGGNPPYQFEFLGYLPDGLTGSSDGTVTGTPTKTGTRSFGVRVTDASGAKVESASSIDVGLPSLPNVQLSTLPAAVAPARGDVKVGIDLDHVAALPISGQVTLSLSADTQNVAANANQPDPHVRFANGQLTSSFQIPAGVQHVDLPLLSTGTVATTMTVSVQKLQASGVDFSAAVTPQIFQVRAVPPVINSVCFVKNDYGIQLTVLGSSTTRELVRGEVTAGSTSKNTDLNAASSDYFGSDGTIRFGGAFTLQFAADAALSHSTGPFSVRLANTAGWSTAMAAQPCQ